MNVELALHHPLRISMEYFRSWSAGTMRGICDVTNSGGMILDECKIHVEGRKAWVVPPPNPIISRDAVVRSRAHGTHLTEPIILFENRRALARWTAAIIDAVRSIKPGAVV